jgi:hypothetical protein
VRLSRRLFGLSVAGMALSTRARAQEVEGEEAHPVPPPPSLEFRTMTWSKAGFFYDGNTTAICAVPKDLSPGARLPLVVLLPGGHHNMQRHDKGCWGWWSEYLLGDVDTALRRGTLTEKDFRALGRPDEIEQFNAYLATTPYRGAVLVTPWVVGRQLDPAPHGAMVAAFLRELVTRCRDELPVIPTREATGLGGMSSGGLWAIHAGAACSDVFGTVVATQPFTEELVKPLRAAVNARAMPQKLRMVTSRDDHQRKSTIELSEALRADKIEHDLVEYLGAHSAAFAAGPGGIDALISFDRSLRGELLDGTRPLPAHDGLAASVSIDDTPRRNIASRESRTSGSLSPTWPIAAIGAVTAGTALAMRRAK